MKKFIITALISLFVMTTSQASTLEDLVVSGNTFWSQGKFAEAEGEFNKALKINPDYSVAHARMANLYLTQNKTTEAVVCGVKTTTIPSFTPEVITASFTSPVMLIICGV